MQALEIEGGSPLNGQVQVSGAKNAALPLMIASLLTEDPVVLSNVPRLTDIDVLGQVLEGLGVEVARAGESDAMTLRAAGLSGISAPYELVSQMRAAFWVIGPLLARCGEARVALPGGCAIGARPVDFYLEALTAMGAHTRREHGGIYARTGAGGLRGARICAPQVSVGLTHTMMMTAALSREWTVIENAAREPEVEDVAVCLRAMGAEIAWDSERTVRVRGTQGLLAGMSYRVPGDRIETGAWAMAVGLGGGALDIVDGQPHRLDAVLDRLRAVGVDVEATNDGMRVSRRDDAVLTAASVTTAPYPGFPTDLQAPFTALATGAVGESVIEETIFENRFLHVPELVRLGADITLSGNRAVVRGASRLEGAPVRAGDLRGSFSLVIAALAARGVTRIEHAHHLQRGFGNLVARLQRAGAQARVVS